MPLHRMYFLVKDDGNGNTFLHENTLYSSIFTFFETVDQFDHNPNRPFVTVFAGRWKYTTITFQSF